MAGLELKSVRKAFGEVEVIHDVDLTIEDRELVVFVGPSGCGKSTLLRLVAGLEETTSGAIDIGGRDVTNVEPASRGVAMVFQSYALYPHMTVAENMGFGLRMNGAPKDEIRRRVDKAAAILHLEELLKRKPKQLSGGQRQRVAIGRAIVREPQVFLFDEPLSNLDAELRVRMRLEISRLHKELGATMIYVTHDQVEAMTLADKIVVLRAGRVEQVGAPLALYEDPDNLFVAGFLGSPRINLMKAVIVERNGRGLTVALPDFGDVRVPLALSEPPPQDAELLLGVRPEHFLADGDVRISTRIDLIEDLGGVSFAYARSEEETPLVIEQKNGRAMREGETVSVAFDPSRALLFDAESGLRLR